MFSLKDKILLALCNSRLVNAFPVRVVINFIVNNINIIRFIFGGRPDFCGQTRLIYRLSHLCSVTKERIRLTPSGIEAGGRLVDKTYFRILDHVAREGIDIAESSPASVRELIRKQVTYKSPYTSRRHYKALSLLMLTIYVGGAANVYLYLVMANSTVGIKFWQILVSVLWLFPTFFFFFNTFLFYCTWFKYAAMKVNFTEATKSEEYQLKVAPEQPPVITLVPSYMEEPALLSRTLYSLCLQNYENNRVVLLLGNDYYSEDAEIRNNTKEVRSMVAGMILDLRKQNHWIKRYYRAFKGMREMDAASLAEQFAYLSQLYGGIAGWFHAKAEFFRNEPVEYPTDKYLIKNVFVYKYRYNKVKAKKCAAIVSELKGTAGSPGLLSDYYRMAEECYMECKRAFNPRLEIFMRTKYANLEKEKTKAGNLTAYFSLIGGTWKEARDENGRLILVPSATGKHIKAPVFMATFDSDTIAKHNYLLRKAVFLGKKENEKVGLIQSPYDVPSPEPTPVSSAAGVQTAWMVILSPGLTHYNAAFWLGFNGLWRFKGLESIRDMNSFMAITMVEDVETSIKLRRRGYSIVTSPERQCITYSPPDLRSLRVQRTRWASGNVRIAKIIHECIKQKEIRLSFVERLHNYNYVLGLCNISVSTFLTYVLYLFGANFGASYQGIEVLPFFAFMSTFFFMVPSITKYRLKHLIDCLLGTPFLNFYYLKGTIKAVQLLFRPDSNKNFHTPRFIKDRHWQLRTFEIVGLTALIGGYIIKLILDIEAGLYFRFFTYYQLFCMLYGLYRFIRNREYPDYPGKMKRLHDIRDLNTQQEVSQQTAVCE